MINKTKSPISNPLKTYAGKSTTDMIIKRRDDLLGGFIFFVTFGTVTYFQFMEVHHPYLFLGLTIIALIYTIAKIITTKRAINKMKQGRDGEIEIASYLDNALRDLLTGTTIRVFHDIPRDKGNIDHSLICDRGIYLIETKGTFVD